VRISHFADDETLSKFNFDDINYEQISINGYDVSRKTRFDMPKDFNGKDFIWKWYFVHYVYLVIVKKSLHRIITALKVSYFWSVKERKTKCNLN